MYLTLRSVAALLLTVAFMVAGGGLLNTLIALRATHEGFPNWVIGLFFSAFSLAYILGCIVVPHWIKAVGHIRVFAALMALTGAATLLMLLIVDPIAWVLLRAVFGFCGAGVQMVIESWMNERAENANRGRLLSIYRMVDLTSVTLGQLLLLLPINLMGHAPFVLVAILTMFAIVPVALTRAPQPRPIATRKLDLSGLYAVSPLAVAGVFLTGLGNSGFWSLAPVFAESHGFDGGNVAWFMVTAIIAGAASQYPIGYLSDRIDRRRVLIVVAALAAVSSLAMALLAGTGTAMLFILTFVFGAFAIPIYAIAAAHANDQAAPDAFVTVASGLLIVYSVGAIVGPVLAGLLMGRFGSEALFYQLAVCQVALVAFGLYRMGRRAAPPATAQAHMVAVPNPTTPVIPVVPMADERA